VALVFWNSGIQKIGDWQTTLALFEYEYQVPLISPTLAAYLGAGFELLLPPLLALGLIGRLPALGLFVFNIMAALSYPGLSPDGVDEHIVWGLLLAVVLVFSPGAWSLDRALCRWLPCPGKSA
jgi:putative oxidoreductase